MILREEVWVYGSVCFGELYRQISGELEVLSEARDENEHTPLV